MLGTVGTRCGVFLIVYGTLAVVVHIGEHDLISHLCSGIWIHLHFGGFLHRFVADLPQVNCIFRFLGGARKVLLVKFHARE
jgi:hypothetical protein